MKPPHLPAYIFFPILALFSLNLLRGQTINTYNTYQAPVSPTPTYDPLEEPPLPPNPSEFELGRNLFWHWCMTCHGDRGQGLTDEFRAVWEPEHQNCWERGCHAGRNGDEGFPIPTVVPAIVDDFHLAQFKNVDELVDYLSATHPPQSPGVLREDEYRTIALFVFTLNERPLIEISITPQPAATMTSTELSPDAPASSSFPINIVIVLSVLIGVSMTLAWKTRLFALKKK